MRHKLPIHPDTKQTPVDIASPTDRAHPLVRGEDRGDYVSLRRRVVALVRPGDVIEQLYVDDIVDLVWEAARMRRVRAAQLESLRHRGLADMLVPLGILTKHTLSDAWARRDRYAVEEVDALLAKAGLTMEHVAARTFALHIDEMERLDRLIATTETRRNTALREIERHRASLARALRTAAEAEDVTDEDGLQESEPEDNGAHEDVDHEDASQQNAPYREDARQEDISQENTALPMPVEWHPPFDPLPLDFVRHTKELP